MDVHRTPKDVLDYYLPQIEAQLNSKDSTREEIYKWVSEVSNKVCTGYSADFKSDFYKLLAEKVIELRIKRQVLGSYKREQVENKSPDHPNNDWMPILVYRPAWERIKESVISIECRAERVRFRKNLKQYVPTMRFAEPQ